jgi:predicted anti-sigma-YlaC factor YlaD
MRRLNPWVLWPTVAAGVIGGVIGWTVTSISCQPNSCVVAATTVTVLAALFTALGVGVVVILAVRSLAEWREAADAGLPPPEVACEAGEPVVPDDAAPDSDLPTAPAQAGP